jgi:hypothetical protein
LNKKNALRTRFLKDSRFFKRIYIGDKRDWMQGEPGRQRDFSQDARCCRPGIRSRVIGLPLGSPASNAFPPRFRRVFQKFGSPVKIFERFAPLLTNIYWVGGSGLGPWGGPGGAWSVRREGTAAAQGLFRLLPDLTAVGGQRTQERPAPARRLPRGRCEALPNPFRNCTEPTFRNQLDRQALCRFRRVINGCNGKTVGMFRDA